MSFSIPTLPHSQHTLARKHHQICPRNLHVDVGQQVAISILYKAEMRCTQIIINDQQFIINDQDCEQLWVRIRIQEELEELDV